jgi:dipeptidyl aminopeptidase/acylaminoacyl peptidase
MKRLLCFLLCGIHLMATAQDKMTIDQLWNLKRVSADGLSSSGAYLYYTTRQYNVATEENISQHYRLRISDGSRQEIQHEGKKIFQRDPQAWYARQDNQIFISTDNGKQWKLFYTISGGNMELIRVSPDRKYIAFTRTVPIQQVKGKERHPDMPKNSAQVYDDLNYRHWDTWEDGHYSHLFVVPVSGGEEIDLIAGKPFDIPQQPFGGMEDFVWHPHGKTLVYVCKKKAGKEYAASTNTDIYQYDVTTGLTVNLTANMNGYDTQPLFSPDGKYLAWTSMARDGYEADKNDLYVLDIQNPKAPLKINLTGDWDESVDEFIWSRDGKHIYFTAAWQGTKQLHKVNFPGYTKMKPFVRRVTGGKFDVNQVIGESGEEIIVSRCDMNHASEIYAVHKETGVMRALTHENDAVYAKIKLSKVEYRSVKTKDNQKMGVWVIYPPDFDPSKKYPTLLYCQGGPQSALTQFYSFRWNFQLMAAHGYIVVAPNRRGMPGWGVAWNEAISKDWGGKAMQDYLDAIDAVAAEPYVDNNRLGCVGASYGGYSVFMLAGMHENRFKSFISHCGLFNLKSWYGTTEELWFANWDVGGPYWENPPLKSYEKFDPSNFVSKWTSPILIIQGGKDFRVPEGQAFEAFQAAQLRNIKSRMLYFPDENHWVLRPQNGIVWQREFFAWLKETL